MGVTRATILPLNIFIRLRENKLAWYFASQ